MKSDIEVFDIAIIGAGPAGLSAAIHAANKNIPHILFEKSKLANTIFDYQLGKFVMAEPGYLPLITEMRFSASTREDVLKKWQEDADRHGINLLSSEVIAIAKINDLFEISHASGKVLSKNIILALGVQGTPRKLELKSDTTAPVQYTLTDPLEYKQEDIFVVGAGDAAIENAISLSTQNNVTIINRSSEFPRAKEANSRSVLDAIDKGSLKCLYNAAIESYTNSKTIIVATPEKDIELPCTRIIARLGAIPPRAFLNSMNLKFTSEDPSAFPVVDDKYQTSVKGIYAIGAIIGYPLIKQAMNQGYEVIEHILGNKIFPADQKLVEEKLSILTGNFQEKYDYLKDALPLFKELSVPQFRELILESSLINYANEQVVFNVNDYTDTFFSIVSGSVKIKLPNGDFVELNQGNFFGEMSLFSGRRRSATVIANPGTVLLETKRRQILKLLRSSNAVSKVIDELFVLRALETSIFPGAKREDLKELLISLEYKNYKKSDLICKEGDLGDRLFIIKKGSVQISRKIGNEDEVPQSYISAGNYFGEMSLLGDQPLPRSATVRAAVTSEIISIGRDAVQSFLKKNPAIASKMKQISDARRVENILRVNNESQGALLGFAFREGITDAENVLIIDSDLCVGCDNCERACAATHSGTSRLDRKGGKSFASLQIPISCRHCENPLCMLDCPPDAIHRKVDGEITIDDTCIGCGNCKHNCPYGVIQMVYPKPPSLLQKFWNKLGLSELEQREAPLAAKCDMCGTLEHGPACVRACPTGAAIRANPKTIMDIIDISE